jgi:hypothetical protein
MSYLRYEDYLGLGVRQTALALVICLVIAPSALAADETSGVYFGLCDASAAVALEGGFFVVADDEDNILRIYHRAAGASALASLDVSRFLRVDPKAPEADLEGAARIGDVIYWITSHGRNVDGKDRPSRQRFFATRITVTNNLPTLTPVGQPYTRLLRDLSSDPRLFRFGLAAAAQLPPKERGALNIEGLAASPTGQLWIGFRNPVPEDRALLVPMLNPAEVTRGATPRFGDPVLLPLGGRGVRSITDWDGRYLIVAGAFHGGGTSDLYLWDGGVEPPRLLDQLHLGSFNAEALARFQGPNQDDLLLISDDGNVLVGRRPCKKLKDAAQKRFRTLIISGREIPPAAAR